MNEQMPAFEENLPVSGYMVPGPLPILSRTAPKGGGLELTLKPEADLRITWLSAKLAQAQRDLAQAVAVAQRSTLLADRCVAMIERLHKVVEERNAQGMAPEFGEAAFDEMSAILAEDKAA
jgi:hypothetical protein